MLLHEKHWTNSAHTPYLPQIKDLYVRLTVESGSPSWILFMHIIRYVLRRIPSHNIMLQSVPTRSDSAINVLAPALFQIAMEGFLRDIPITVMDIIMFWSLVLQQKGHLQNLCAIHLIKICLSYNHSGDD